MAARSVYRRRHSLCELGDQELLSREVQAREETMEIIAGAVVTEDGSEAGEAISKKSYSSAAMLEL